MLRSQFAMIGSTLLLMTLSITAVPVEVQSATSERTAIEGLIRDSAKRWPERDVRELARVIDQAARDTQLAPELILGIIWTESTFERRAQSSAGAVGLMQLKPSTAESFASRAGVPWRGEATLNDPAANVRIGTTYLRYLLGRFRGDLDHALAAYCHGPMRVRRMLEAQGRLQPETHRYGQKVRAAWARFSEHSARIAANDTERPRIDRVLQPS